MNLSNAAKADSYPGDWGIGINKHCFSDHY
jgi:hypothetical protein